jgi:hypothetical protein
MRNVLAVPSAWRPPSPIQQSSTLIGSTMEDVIFSMPHFAKALLRIIPYHYVILEKRSVGTKFKVKK